MSGSQLAQGHRVVILQVIEKIVHEKLEVIDKQLAVSLVKQASRELTQETVCRCTMKHGLRCNDYHFNCYFCNF